MWKNADRTVPLEIDPSECGWVLQNNSFRLKWFDGDQILDNVGKAIDESPDDEESDDDYRYSLISDDSDNEDDIDILKYFKQQKTIRETEIKLKFHSYQSR